MKYALVFLLIGYAVTSSGQSAKPIFPKPLSPRLANYEIDVTLDPATKKLNGRETLTWKNASPDIIRELRFHLYLNAFRNDKSTFMRESGGSCGALPLIRIPKKTPMVPLISSP